MKESSSGSPKDDVEAVEDAAVREVGVAEAQDHGHGELEHGHGVAHVPPGRRPHGKFLQTQHNSFGPRFFFAFRRVWTRFSSFLLDFVGFH